MTVLAATPNAATIEPRSTTARRRRFTGEEALSQSGWRVCSPTFAVSGRLRSIDRVRLIALKTRIFVLITIRAMVVDIGGRHAIPVGPRRELPCSDRVHVWTIGELLTASRKVHRRFTVIQGGRKD